MELLNTFLPNLSSEQNEQMYLLINKYGGLNSFLVHTISTACKFKLKKHIVFLYGALREVFSCLQYYNISSEQLGVLAHNIYKLESCCGIENTSDVNLLKTDFDIFYDILSTGISDLQDFIEYGRLIYVFNSYISININTIHSDSILSSKKLDANTNLSEYNIDDIYIYYDSIIRKLIKK